MYHCRASWRRDGRLAVRGRPSKQAATFDEVWKILRLARTRELPSLCDSDGIRFWETTLIYLDHHGIEVGRVLVVHRNGNRFDVQGWVHPLYASEVGLAATSSRYGRSGE